MLNIFCIEINHDYHQVIYTIYVYVNQMNPLLRNFC